MSILQYKLPSEEAMSLVASMLGSAQHTCGERRVAAYAVDALILLKITEALDHYYEQDSIVAPGDA